MQNGIQTLDETELQALEFEKEKPENFPFEVPKASIKTVFLRKLLKAAETAVINRKSFWKRRFNNATKKLLSKKNVQL